MYLQKKPLAGCWSQAAKCKSGAIWWLLRAWLQIYAHMPNSSIWPLALVTSKFLLFGFFNISVHTSWSTVWSPELWRYLDILDDCLFYYWMHWKKDTLYIKKKIKKLSKSKISFLFFGVFLQNKAFNKNKRRPSKLWEYFFFLKINSFEISLFCFKGHLLIWYLKPKHWLQYDCPNTGNFLCR